MATRYYFPFSTGAPAAPITSFSVDAGWDINNSAGFARGYAQTTKVNTALTAETGSQFAETGTTVGNLVHKQYITDPLDGDQTISGTFTLVLRCGQGTTGGTAGAADMSLQCIIRVIAPDGTVRGTVYGGHTATLNASGGALGQEMASSTQVRLMSSVTVNSVSALNGDRLVIELGHRHHNTLNDGSGYYSYLHLGDSTAVADHPTSTTTEAKPGWLELSSTLAHGFSGTGSITETGSLSSTGAKVAKSDPVLSGTVSATSTGAKVTPNPSGDGSISGETVSATSTGAKAPPTRYYFPFGVGAPAAQVTTIDPDAGWDLVGAGFARTMLATRKHNTALLAETSSQFYETSSVAGNLVHEQYVSPPIVSAKLISGAFTLVLRCGEVTSGGTAADANISLQCIIRVIKADGTLRGTLYGGHTTALNATSGAVGQEMNTTTQVRLMNKVPLTPVTAEAGDRLVVELGHRHHNTTTVTYGSFLHLGDSAAVDDHPLSTSSEAKPGWFELSVPVGHKVAGTGVISGTESLVSTGKKIAKTAPNTSGAGAISSSGAKRVASLLEFTLDGTDGGNIGTTGTNFNSVIPGTGGSIKFREAGAWKNQYGEFATTATASAPQAGNTVTSTSIIYARYYFRAYANPTVDVQTLKIRGTSFAQRLTVRLTTTGTLQLHNGTTAVATMTTPINLNTWVRIEAAYFGTTMTCRLFNDPRSDTPTETISGAATSDTIQSVLIGFATNHSNYKLDYDEVAFDSNNYPAKISRAAGTGSISGTASFSRSGFKRAISAGWGIIAWQLPLTSTGDKSAAEFHNGTGTISGTAAFARSGKKVAKGSQTLSGTSSLSSVGKKVAKGANTLSGTSTPTPVGKKIAKGTVTLSGTATPTPGTGFKDVAGTGSINATSALAAIGKKVAKGGPALPIVAVTTTLGSSGFKAKVFVTGLITATHTLTSTGRKVAKGINTLPGTGTLTPAGRKIALGDGAVYNGHTLTSLGSRNTNYFQGTGLVTGNVSATSTGQKVARGSGTLSGPSSLTANTKKVAKGTALISGVSSGPSTVLGKKVAKGSQTLSGFVGAVSVGSKNAQTGLAIVNGFVLATTVPGKKSVTGTGSGSGSGTITSAGRKNARGTGLVAGSGSQISSGNSRQLSSGNGQINSVGSLISAPGFKTVGGFAAIAHIAVFAANGEKRSFITGEYEGTAVLTPAGRKVARGSAAVSGAVGATSIGRKTGKGAQSLTASASLAAGPGGQPTHSGTGSVAGTSMINSFGHIRNPRNPIKVGGKSGAVLIGANLSRAVPLGVSLED